MIWVVNESEPKRLVAHIFRLGTDGVRRAPEVLYAHSAADFILVTGRIDLAEHITSAVTIAREERTENQLAIAVMVADPGRTADVDPAKELHSVFDTIFVVKADEAEEVVKRLARALITPVNAFQLGCCDWNDLRCIVGAQGSHARPRFGFGRATGHEFARRAAHAALEHLDCRRPGRANTCAVVTMTLPKNARAAWYK